MSKDGILIDKEWFIALGGQPNMPKENEEPTDYGLSIYGDPESEIFGPPGEIHLHILISFQEQPAKVYLEEYDNGGQVNGTVELPMIKTRVDLLSLMDCFGVVREWGDA